MKYRYCVIIVAILFAVVLMAGCTDPASTPTPSGVLDIASLGVPSASDTLAPTPITEPTGASAPSTAPDTPSPSEGAPRILQSTPLGYYLSGWQIIYNGGRIWTDTPTGTGTEHVNCYIQPTGGEAELLTPSMDVSRAFLVEEWLYFWYADVNEITFDTCRMNISTRGDPEFLNVFGLMASDDYFYYYRNWGEHEVYRRDRDFENETITFQNVKFRDELYPVGSRIIRFSEDYTNNISNNVFSVCDQEGNTLDTVELDVPMAWRVTNHEGIFYWCDRAITETASVRLHTYDLKSGSMKTVEGQFATESDVGNIDGGIVLGVREIADGYAYVTLDILYPEAESKISIDNTFLYKIPLEGGTAEFVRSWFES